MAESSRRPACRTSCPTQSGSHYQEQAGCAVPQSNRKVFNVLVMAGTGLRLFVFREEMLFQDRFRTVGRRQLVVVGHWGVWNEESCATVQDLVYRYDL